MNTLFVGRRLIRLKSVSSTNNFAATLSMSEAPDGTVVIAEEQTSGKGQHGRHWHVEKGLNITATVVFRPSFMSLNHLPYFNKGIALAVCKTIRYFLKNESVLIKWPNDIYCKNFKLAGILTENSIRGSHIVSYLAGIGINVNQIEFHPEAKNAASIINFTQQQTSLEEVLEILCEQLESVYFILKRGNLNEIDKNYHESLLGKNQWNKFHIDNEKFKAKIIGVNADGLLEIQHQSGEISRHRSGEIGYLV